MPKRADLDFDDVSVRSEYQGRDEMAPSACIGPEPAWRRVFFLCFFLCAVWSLRFAWVGIHV